MGKREWTSASSTPRLRPFIEITVEYARPLRKAKLENNAAMRDDDGSVNRILILLFLSLNCLLGFC